jgi:hypothetical protein
MFLIFGFSNGANDMGVRKCRFFSCCGSYDVLAGVTCTFQQFTLFFIPIFRFGRRYFVSCPNCGAVYEMSKDEGKRIARDPTAEINPNALVMVQRANKKTCPNCKCAVDPSCRYCPNCGTNLF